MRTNKIYNNVTLQWLGEENRVSHSLFLFTRIRDYLCIATSTCTLSLFLYCCSVLSVGQAVIYNEKEQHVCRQVKGVGI